ncbi:hypothetical protein GCM10009721_20320 [Terrabacter tumescens]|uniref:Uncharacterized protein n=1 Tax=Terrabacter tumescens TaxID=60443 RepID=A0ABQ2HWX8_9MICO|nr:hypothetical protein [Terrabacter tumescens]GGM94085.1 hypothetical protein GCM10009721_20320 [Terrabacter tumescens]
MDRADELSALTDVRLRLQEHFPQLDADVVEAAVRLAHSELTGPVRDFVPVLVEHAARDRLSFALREQVAPPDRTPPTASDG